MKLDNTIDPAATPTFTDHQPADNTAAVVTLAADVEEYHVIDWILLSYDAAPTGGNLLVTVGGVTYLSVDIVAGGPVLLDFNTHPIYNPAQTKNEAVVVTLAAGGASIAGKLTVRSR